MIYDQDNDFLFFFIPQIVLTTVLPPGVSLDIPLQTQFLENPYYYWRI